MTQRERSADGVGERSAPGSTLDGVRESEYQPAALLAALLVGLGFAQLHWLGLFVAGALVGLVSESLRRAVAAGLAVGVLALLVHVLASPVMSPGEFLGLAPVAYVTIAVGLVAPLWGSLVRGVV